LIKKRTFLRVESAALCITEYVLLTAEWQGAVVQAQAYYFGVLGSATGHGILNL
jgi:hypothetical protein